MPGSIRGHLGYVLSHQRDHNILPLIENAVEARTELAPMLAGNRWALFVSAGVKGQQPLRCPSCPDQRAHPGPPRAAFCNV